MCCFTPADVMSSLCALQRKQIMLSVLSVAPCIVSKVVLIVTTIQ